MPSQPKFDEQIYEAMQKGRGLTFRLQTGGVKYKAVLQHKEARAAAIASSTSQASTDSSATSSVKSPQS